MTTTRLKAENCWKESRPKTAIICLWTRAYEDNETRALAEKQGFIPVVPPKSNRKEPWEYDKEIYKRRNEIERFFLRIKRFRRVFTRYDKLDIVYAGIFTFAMIFDAILC